MPSRADHSSKPALPPGQRVYAVGDVHGEGALLRRVLTLIRDDNATRGQAEVTLVFVGDLIDRGPDAAAILTAIARMPGDRVVVIRGNHETALLEAYRGDQRTLIDWLPFGAAATLAGFGVTARHIDSPIDVFETTLRAHVAPSLIDWVERLPGKWECGDYYFTHAGVRPGVPLDEQDARDLQWIREPFLSSKKRHGKVIIHGHTVEPGVPPLGRNRIGIDTGAYEHGVLTALGLEGSDQWLLQAKGDRSARGASMATSGDADAALATDIPALIAAIVAPPEPMKPTRVRRALTDAALLLRDPIRRTKKMGKAGYVTAGFALIAAIAGGVIAVGSRQPAPSQPGGVTIAVPEMPAATESPAPASAAIPPARKPAARNAAVRRPVARRADAPVTDNAADGPSPRLYGNELDRALDEDRVTTRRLNQEELSRGAPPPPAPK